MAKYKRRWGDRYDGRLIRSLGPFYKIVPYIMKTRLDSQNLFDDRIDITNTEAFIRERNADENKPMNITFLHVMIAAAVRTISQKPGINRFIAGQKIYARNDILVSIAIKKQMTEAGEETTVKVKFDPDDTIYDVAAKMNAEIMANKNTDEKNDADKTAKLFMLCPGFVVKFLVWFLTKLDYFGKMPKAINRVSPFHTSFFITDLGSLGVEPVYHHLYEFGTTSVFVAFGSKHKVTLFDSTGKPMEKRYINMRVVSDERIADGFYLANTFKMFRRLMQHPERLMTKPEQVYEDLK